jgi:ribosomal protein S18 acetylase RimI-like enzyme
MDLDIRPATKTDIPDLSKLLLMATDGIVASLYEGVIPGLPTHEIVERRLARDGTCGSYANCWVAADTHSSGTRIAGKLHAYPMDDVQDDPPDPLVPEERYRVLEPFGALDEPAAGSYYINVIAVYPDYRRLGLGGRMLDLARDQAEARGFSQLSLAVFEENESAVRLYERRGFTVVARAPAPAHPLIPFSGDMLMMMRPV